MATLKLLAMVQVVVTPPPDVADQLLWNGRLLKANEPSRYLPAEAQVQIPSQSQDCSYCSIVLMRSIQAAESGMDIGRKFSKLFACL